MEGWKDLYDAGYHLVSMLDFGGVVLLVSRSKKKLNILKEERQKRSVYSSIENPSISLNKTTKSMTDPWSWYTFLRLVDVYSKCIVKPTYHTWILWVIGKFPKDKYLTTWRDGCGARAKRRGCSNNHSSKAILRHKAAWHAPLCWAKNTDSKWVEFLDEKQILVNLINSFLKGWCGPAIMNGCLVFWEARMATVWPIWYVTCWFRLATVVGPESFHIFSESSWSCCVCGVLWW